MKKLFIAVLLLFLAIALLGCNNLPFSLPFWPSDQNNPVPNQNLPTGNLCYNPDVKNEQADSICTNLESQGLKDSCYESEAEFSKNAFFCEQIQSPEKKFACLLKIGSPNSSLPPCNNNPDQNNPILPDQNIPAPDQNNQTKPYNGECDSKPAGSQRDACIKDLAKANKNPGYCSLLTVISKDDCVYEIAIQEKNSLLCETLSGESLGNSCFYSTGIASNNEKACQKISQNITETILKRDDCLKTVALAKSDEKICGLMSASYVTDTYSRDECYWSIFSKSKDNALCEKFLSEQKKEECISQSDINAVTGTKDLEGCKKLPTDKNINDCITSLAISTKNFIICSEMTDSNSTRTCYIKMTEFFDAFSNDILCLLMNHTEDKEECYKKLAAATLNPDYCAKINFTQAQDACYSDLGKKTSNAEICAKILPTDPVPWDDCFSTVAIAQKDANLCLKIKSQEKMPPCVFDVAVAVKSLGICKIFPNNYLRSYSQFRLDWLCYNKYSVATNDIFICESIKDANVKAACNDRNSTFR